jgi:putative membrane protein
MLGLRHERERLQREHLIHGESAYPVSMTLIIAVLLLAIGLLAIVSMVFRTGPFG